MTAATSNYAPAWRLTWGCANPLCRALRETGRPRVLLVGRLAPGSAVETPACRSCGNRTTIAISATGDVQQGCSHKGILSPRR